MTTEDKGEEVDFFPFFNNNNNNIRTEDTTKPPIQEVSWDDEKLLVSDFNDDIITENLEKEYLFDNEIHNNKEGEKKYNKNEIVWNKASSYKINNEEEKVVQQNKEDLLPVAANVLIAVGDAFFEDTESDDDDDESDDSSTLGQSSDFL